MPNLKSVRERFASLDERERRLIAWWNDGLTEQGYDVPSGKALAEWFKNRTKPKDKLIDPHSIKEKEF